MTTSVYYNWPTPCKISLRYWCKNRVSDIVDKYFSEFKTHDLFVVSASLSSSNHYSFVTVFGFRDIYQNQVLKFYVNMIHNIFIVIDLTKSIGALLNIVGTQRITWNGKIPIEYRIYLRKLLPGHTISRINIPITTTSGEILVPQQMIQNCRILKTLTVVVNN